MAFCFWTNSRSKLFLFLLSFLSLSLDRSVLICNNSGSGTCSDLDRVDFDWRERKKAAPRPLGRADENAMVMGGHLS